MSLVASSLHSAILRALSEKMRPFAQYDYLLSLLVELEDDVRIMAGIEAYKCW